MNKNLYVFGIILSIFFAGTLVYYFFEAREARENLNEALVSYSAYTSYLDSDEKPFFVTIRVGLWSLVYSVFFLIMSIVALAKVKTTTATSMSIIGVSLSGIFILWDFLMMYAAHTLTYDLIYFTFFLYSAYLIAYSIIQLIQFNRYEDLLENGKQEELFVSKRNDILDM